MPRWTEEQQQAIDLENSNILVSAGAGSGKTAVLSERALRKVKEGVNIDQILILTFTKAAAYEMMLRIRNKISKAGLTEQLNRIDKAYITTFDSFALSVVKKYHDRLNLSQNITIVDENVINLLKKETIDEIFDYFYKNSNPHFEKMITDFCLRDDAEIKKYILDLNNKLDLKYDKSKYLETYINEYYSNQIINNRVLEYEELLKLVAQYQPKKIYILGFYNVTNKSQDIFAYANYKLYYLAKKYEMEFINLQKILKRNTAYLDFSNNYGLNNEEYRKISQIIIDQL